MGVRHVDGGGVHSDAVTLPVCGGQDVFRMIHILKFYSQLTLLENFLCQGNEAKQTSECNKQACLLRLVDSAVAL